MTDTLNPFCTYVIYNHVEGIEFSSPSKLLNTKKSSHKTGFFTHKTNTKIAGVVLPPVTKDLLATGIHVQFLS